MQTAVSGENNNYWIENGMKRIRRRQICTMSLKERAIEMRLNSEHDSWKNFNKILFQSTLEGIQTFFCY